MFDLFAFVVELVSRFNGYVRLLWHVDIMIRGPEGKLITIVEICKRIAEQHGGKGCCSLTTGIFITAINAAEESKAQGNSVLDILEFIMQKVLGKYKVT